MNATPEKSGYSADVQMRLNLNGFALPIGQLGPDFIILRDAPDHPAADAEIVVSIDGDERRWLVHLPDGISLSRTETRTVPIETTEC